MRLIDWNRGTPYIFISVDKELLEETDMLFARKFDCTVDKEIVNYVVEKLNVK